LHGVVFDIFVSASSSGPGDKPDDHENADRADRGEGAAHSDPHRDLDEAEIVTHAGGLILLVSRLISLDLRGSDTILVSIKSHFGHSKVRFSEWSGRASRLVRFIRLRHLAQRGRSIGTSRTSVSE
jgi:hypothetical protein